MKQLFCSECGLQLQIFRKALPKLGRIIDVVEPHKCLEVPRTPDFEPQEIPIFGLKEPTGHFVQKLNELGLPKGAIDPDSLESQGDPGPGDRRAPEHTKSSSSAPSLILEEMIRRRTGE